MFTANPIPSGNGRYVVSFIGPVPLKPVEVRSLHEAKRVVYFKTRMYIVDKLTSWLLQRQYALRLSHHPEAEKIHAAISLVEIGLKERRLGSLRSLCAYIELVEAKLKLAAPPVTSKHFKHFTEKIQPILDFATGREMVLD